MMTMESKNRRGKKSPAKVSHDGFSACSRNALLMAARNAALSRFPARTAAITSSMCFSEIAFGKHYTAHLNNKEEK
jgi:hypothetical protein